MAAKQLPQVRNADELEALIHEIGFLPLCANDVQGFSVNECTPPSMWFVRDVIGPWEWRETLADSGRVAYGKFFQGKAGFISPAWLPDFCNWRREGLSFQERYEEGRIPRAQKLLMDTLNAHGPMLTRDLKSILGKKGFDRTAQLLQMRTDIVIQRFEYRRDAQGQAHGMGTGRLATPETIFGDMLIRARFDDPPEDSFARLVSHVQQQFSDAKQASIERLLK